jgi:hypothetical protein
MKTGLAVIQVDLPQGGIAFGGEAKENVRDRGLDIVYQQGDGDRKMEPHKLTACAVNLGSPAPVKDLDPACQWLYLSRCAVDADRMTVVPEQECDDMYES